MRFTVEDVEDVAMDLDDCAATACPNEAARLARNLKRRAVRARDGEALYACAVAAQQRSIAIRARLAGRIQDALDYEERSEINIDVAREALRD